MLRAELERRSPGRAATVLARAADWCEANGDVEAAIEYAIAAQDRGRAAGLLAEAAFPAYSGGRFTTVERWFHAVDDPELLGHHPAIAVFGTWMNTLAGRPQAAERWAQAAFRAEENGRLRNESKREGWLSLLRAVLATDGVEAMRADAERAAAGLASDGIFATGARLLLGFAHLLEGSDELADEAFAAAVDLGARAGATVGVAMALAERSLLAVRHGDLHEAEELVRRARQIVEDAGLESYGVTAIVHTAAARVALARGRRPTGREELERAARLVPRLTYAMAWAAAPTRLELAHLELAFGNAAAARALLDEIDALATHRPDLGVVGEQAAELRRQVESGRSAEDGWSAALTAAELRLLPLLATYLSFRQIGERLDISRNTVKTQAIAVYRKLGVSSRSQAISRAAELGLL
jgi:LuxR family maltose regulon positive regulatory protein